MKQECIVNKKIDGTCTITCMYHGHKYTWSIDPATLMRCDIESITFSKHVLYDKYEGRILLSIWLDGSAIISEYETFDEHIWEEK